MALVLWVQALPPLSKEKGGFKLMTQCDLSDLRELSKWQRLATGEEITPEVEIKIMEKISYGKLSEPGDCLLTWLPGEDKLIRTNYVSTTLTEPTIKKEEEKLSCPYCKSTNIGDCNFEDNNIPKEDRRFSTIWSMGCLMCQKRFICVAYMNGDKFYAIPYDYFSQEMRIKKPEFSDNSCPGCGARGEEKVCKYCGSNKY